MAETVCGTCRHWSSELVNDFGNLVHECRRHAPVQVTPTGNGRWPYTLSYEWCGDYGGKIGRPPKAEATE